MEPSIYHKQRIWRSEMWQSTICANYLFKQPQTEKFQGIFCHITTCGNEGTTQHENASTYNSLLQEPEVGLLINDL